MVSDIMKTPYDRAPSILTLFIDKSALEKNIDILSITMATSHSSTSSFLLGAASALSAVALYQAYQKSRKASSSMPSSATQRMRSISSSSSSPKDKDQPPHQPPSAQAILDSPDLDLRLLRKAEAVIQWRTTGLTVVVERCTNDHNYSAILRTAEALGVQNVFIVDPAAIVQEDDKIVETTPDGGVKKIDSKGKTILISKEEIDQKNTHKLFAQNATEWLTITNFATTAECIQALRETGHAIWVTDLSQEAVPLVPEELAYHAQQQQSTSDTDKRPCWPIPSKLAIVFGTEAVGCSQEMLQSGDLRVYLPLRGFADSLNLSVATALILHHLFILHPDFVGMATEDEQKALRQAWFPKLAQQRLMSKADKKERQRLLSHISKCEGFQAKQDAGLTLTIEQADKLARVEEFRTRLAELEASSNLAKATDAMKEWIEHPPQPLTDLRRADSHRVTYVGKSTKKLNQEHWKHMAAVANAASTEKSTASFFRDQVNAQENS